MLTFMFYFLFRIVFLTLYLLDCLLVQNLRDGSWQNFKEEITTLWNSLEFKILKIWDYLIN